jgi:tetratricopeptide (TPR) repeat protein
MTTLSIAAELQRARDFAQAKDQEAAEAVYQRLIRLAPQHRDVLRHYGIFKLQHNDSALACEHLQRCVDLDARDGVAHKYLGLGRLRLGSFDAAVAALAVAAAELPKDPDTRYFQAQTLGAMKQFDEAVNAIGAALQLRPDHPSYLNTLASLFSQKNQDRRALPVLYRALDLSPDFWSARLTLAHVLMRLNRHKEAISHYQEVMKDSPDRIDVLTNMGNAHAALDQITEAEQHFEKLLTLFPDDPGVHQNLGNLFSRQNRYDEALAAYERALALKTTYPEARNNYAITLRRLNRVAESLVQLDQAVAERPDFADAQWNRSLSLLLLGDLKQGFDAYEWRWRGGVKELRPRQLNAPLWALGEDITGKTLFVHSEQGLGDHLQFMRYLPLLASRGVRVLAEFPEPLLALGRLYAPEVTWIERGTRMLPPFDRVCALLSLPNRLGTTLSDIPAPQGYLHAPPETIARFADLVHHLPGLKVGLVWSGNPKHQNDRNRSTTLERVLAALPSEGISCISLMKEIRPEDQATLIASGRVLDLSAQLDTFVDTAGLISNVDLVISVDTSVAHLAGALGKPVWVLVPFAPDWRWLLDRSDTPWYTAMRLYRQHAPQRWDEALANIGRDLAQLVARAPQPTVSAAPR